MFLSQVSLAQTGPETLHGTGLSYANAACPYPQTTIPAQVLSRRDRILDEATNIQAKYETAKRQADEIGKDRLFKACQLSVNAIIRKACGGDENASEGQRGVLDFEDHMRGVELLTSHRLIYSETYNIVYNGIMSSQMTMDRAVAGSCPCGYDISIQSCKVCPEGSDNTSATEGEMAPGDWTSETWDDKAVDNVDLRPDTPVVPTSSCFDFAKLDGIIDDKICDVTNESNPKIKKNCVSCLRTSSAYPRGIYPTKFKEYYDLQQDLATLKGEYERAIAKAACVETHIDNAPEKGLNAEDYSRCIKNADPLATAADFCLFCDEAGQTAKRDWGLSFNRWAPPLFTAGAWLLGGLVAKNQVEVTRDTNTKLGYPSDPRQPVILANYVMNGFGQVVNSLQAAGAFGCAPSAGVNGQGQVVIGGIGAALGSIFGGNQGIQIGGANGYPAGYINGQATLSGGVFNGNPGAGPWTSGNLNGSIDAQRAAIAQAQANLEILQRQNQQRVEGLNALASLQVSLQGLEAQNARTNQQMAEIQAQANSIYAGLNANGGVNGNIYGNGQTAAGVRLGFDVSAYGGLNAGGAAYAGGVPLTQFPPTQQQYNGPGYTLPNNSGSYDNSYYNSNYNTPNSGLAVPSLGI